MRQKEKRLRSLILGLALAVAGMSTALADPPPFRAGVTRITVQDTTPFDALIAYPTEAAEVFVEEGPIRLLASRDAAVAAWVETAGFLAGHLRR